ncbi:MAG TPA: 5-(carboxyamino)imidazole ribonucleotide mutase [Anaerolineales bacterium]|nr:5-(carboxyamino)imidazole ribonucleotide mutase [Anaerolineales bacterium]
MNHLVVILMGSAADRDHCQKIATACQELGLNVVQRVGSAHKTPQHASQLLAEYETDPRPKVYITVAGRSNALSGFTDGSVNAPVIACPPFSELDVYSSLRMPAGVAPAVVLEPLNAALFAGKIIALFDPAVREKVLAWRQASAEKVLAGDRDLLATQKQ